MRVQKETIIRTIVLIVALLNQLLVFLGKDKFAISENDVYQYASCIVTVLASLWNWWKNNSFTEEAIAADEALMIMKAEKKEEIKIKESDENLIF